jgi:hypothetical protein
LKISYPLGWNGTPEDEVEDSDSKSESSLLSVSRVVEGGSLNRGGLEFDEDD